MIVSQLIREEQKMLNDLGMTGKGWTTAVGTITTVANQAEYEITDDGFGKPLYVYRDLGNNVLRPVPYTDYQAELDNQSYSFVIVPATSGAQPQFSGEKIAFFHAGQGGVPFARLYPTPAVDGDVYTYAFARGAVDWESFTWQDTPILPEWSHLKTLRAAMFLIARTEWEGYSRQDNFQQRQQYATSMSQEHMIEDPKWDAYIRNPQAEGADDSGYWWEGR
jgi:hypothetical protein